MNKMEEDISEFSKDLSTDQKKKYRRQYIKTMLMAGVLSTVYGLSCFSAIIYFFATKSALYLGLALVLMKFLFDTIYEAKDSIELIQQRIVKRSKRNKKQELQGEN